MVDGNIQAVLDEYAHSLGVKGEDLIEQISEGMNLRTSTLDIDTYESFVGKRKKSGLRAHFAVGYYNAKGDNDNIQRTENIRAFTFQAICTCNYFYRPGGIRFSFEL